MVWTFFRIARCVSNKGVLNLGLSNYKNGRIRRQCSLRILFNFSQRCLSRLFSVTEMRMFRKCRRKMIFSWFVRVSIVDWKSHVLQAYSTCTVEIYFDAAWKDLHPRIMLSYPAKCTVYRLWYRQILVTHKVVASHMINYVFNLRMNRKKVERI